jgi:multiple antibiotic resistance protein
VNFDTHLATLFLQAVAVVFASLFPVLNPIGSAIIMLPFTTDISEDVRRFVAKKVARNTLIVLTAVLALGSHVLAFFGISVPVVQAAGGMVLVSMGWKLLNADDRLSIDKEGAARPGALSEQTFYPFTFPITVGPGSVAVTLTLSAHTTHEAWAETVASQVGALVGFVALAGTVYLSLAYTVSLLKRVGTSGTKVTMRLMAFIILCIGAQISWNGVHALLSQLR